MNPHVLFKSQLTLIDQLIDEISPYSNVQRGVLLRNSLNCKEMQAELNSVLYLVGTCDHRSFRKELRHSLIELLNKYQDRFTDAGFRQMTVAILKCG